MTIEPSDSMLLDLRYFLEMIDIKHRYGANLAVYHEEWQRSSIDANFFFWLDHGAGRHLSLVGCSREKLEKERIRYLSKDERKNYLVTIDDNGLLRWEKNNELITTSVDHFRDSMDGIIPTDSAEAKVADAHAADVTLPTKIAAVGGLVRDTVLADSSSHSTDDDSSISSSGPALDGEKDSERVQPATRDKRPRRRLFVSPATILNQLLRATVRPGTWIYVADTVGRLYVGIKASGAFQHASFLSGARISSAGIIGIERGQLRYLSPLSGHYRPTTRSFRRFISALEAQGVDRSQLKVSTAYAVLLGMEAYSRSKRDIGRVMHPHDEAKKEGRRRRTASRASTIGSGDRHSCDGAASATEHVERRWREEHERRGLARLFGSTTDGIQ